MTSVVVRSICDGQNCTPEQFSKQEPVFEHALQRTWYLTSWRPPSDTGRDHVTSTMLSATTVILMFLGSEGGAVENVHSLLARMVSPEGKINVYFFQSARAFPDSHWIERTKICRRI